ncbi:MAG: glycosyltransferase family 4 protein [Candidatus Thiodiazotropha sp. (ex Myrtea sp. 'scaly one' KF741663)]|nr:glycosyltransferase family 4 protein [Candidatus Thiodiazotropha sp. (ex Myrtea sp. 'scaly one' KF741663)]
MASICIVANFAYGAMTNSESGHIGGVERQTALLAKWLANNTKHKVSIITWNENDLNDEIIDNVTVIKLCRRDDGIPGIRFFYPRWHSLIRSLKKANADVYYQNCAEYVTGQVALWCRLNNRKFIYSVASDPDCDINLPSLRTYREKVLYKYGLKNANRIICQTKSQQNSLRLGFSLNSEVLPMPCPGPMDNLIQPKHLQDGKFHVLWVGRIASVKRVEVLLDIAESLDGIIFEIAGGADQELEYARNILDRASAISNVILHGKLNREQLNKRYSAVSAFCNTSLYEGFPNTFLEAWSYCLPVVSTINPDTVITNNDIGINVKSTEEFINAFILLRDNEGIWKSMSNRAREYYLANHSTNNAMNNFLEIFENETE